MWNFILLRTYLVHSYLFASCIFRFGEWKWDGYLSVDTAQHNDGRDPNCRRAHYAILSYSMWCALPFSNGKCNEPEQARKRERQGRLSVTVNIIYRLRFFLLFFRGHNFISFQFTLRILRLPEMRTLIKYYWVIYERGRWYYWRKSRHQPSSESTKIHAIVQWFSIHSFLVRPLFPYCERVGHFCSDTKQNTLTP